MNYKRKRRAEEKAVRRFVLLRAVLLPCAFVVQLREVKALRNSTITIPLDPETARAYETAGPEEKRKMQALLSLWLRELAAGQHPALQQVLDEVGCKAKARGLTQETLDSLLKGA